MMNHNSAVGTYIHIVHEITTPNMSTGHFTTSVQLSAIVHVKDTAPRALFRRLLCSTGEEPEKTRLLLLVVLVLIVAAVAKRVVHFLAAQSDGVVEACAQPLCGVLGLEDGKIHDGAGLYDGVAQQLYVLDECVNRLVEGLDVRRLGGGRGKGRRACLRGGRAHERLVGDGKKAWAYGDIQEGDEVGEMAVVGAFVDAEGRRGAEGLVDHVRDCWVGKRHSNDFGMEQTGERQIPLQIGSQRRPGGECAHKLALKKRIFEPRKEAGDDIAEL